VLAPLLLFAAPSVAAPNTNLLTNAGFETGTAGQLPGWQRIGGGPVELDAAVRHSGKRSVRVSGPGGVQSVLIPHAGGRLKVSGWVRTENVVCGAPAPWHKAAFQVISYDQARNGRGVRHRAVGGDA